MIPAPRQRLQKDGTTGLVLRLLGPLEATLDGRPFLRSGMGKSHALLAYLALEGGRSHRRSALAELFWPGQPLERSRHRLRQMLLDLQQALRLEEPSPILAVDRETVRFEAPQECRLDAAEVLAVAPHCEHAAPGECCPQCAARMEEAVHLLRGEFLEGLSLPDCPNFEDWLLARREALQRHAQALLEQLVTHHQHQGNHARALAFAQRHAALAPWDEAGLRRLMRLQALNGQPGAALAQYDAARRLLAKELGIPPEEETVRLAEAIRKGELAKAPAPADSGRAMEQGTLHPGHGELRQVTVLYCELAVPDTEDPEDALERLRQPQERCAQLVEKFGGHCVAAHDGGLLAYFGYPRAQEHGALWAMRAALALAGERFPSVEIRVGVHTGPIVTGRDASVPDAIGKTSGMAIQLRRLAGSGEAIASSDTRRLVSGYFEWENLGVLPFHGTSRPQAVFKVRRESGARTRLEAVHGIDRRLPPLIGREPLLAGLLSHWEQAVRGKQSVALLRGEAGIGKSRLVRALRAQVEAAGADVRELRCFPEYCQTPFRPVIALMESLCGFAAQDGPEIRFAKLAGYMAQRYPHMADATVPLAAQLLALPLAAPYRAPDLTPQKQKERTLGMLLDLLAAPLSERQPVLLIVEDLHWIDPSTLDLVARLVEREGRAPVMVTLTARPEFHPPWPDEAMTTWEVPPLSDEQILAMARSLAADMDAPLLQWIAARSDGVPLFIEEMVRMGLPQSTVPATLQDLLATRLDATGSAKPLAQLAATLGRKFRRDLLRIVWPGDAAAVEQGLRDLQEARLVADVGDGHFQFRHALIQEAAYRSQPRAMRQAAHLRIAAALENGFPDVVENQPEILAQHLAAGGRQREAIDWWLKAARRAAQQWANREARNHLGAGLALLTAQPPSAERDCIEIQFQTLLAHILMAVDGYRAVGTREAFARVHALAESVPGSERFDVLLGLWVTGLGETGELVAYSEGLASARRLLALAEEKGIPAQLMSAHYACGNSLFVLGRFAEAEGHLRATLCLYEAHASSPLAAAYGEDPGLMAQGLLSEIMLRCGRHEEAFAAVAKAEEIARRRGHSHSLCFVRACQASLHRTYGQPEACLRYATENAAIAESCGLDFWRIVAQASIGWAQTLLGDERGLGLIRQSIEHGRLAMPIAEEIFLSMYAEAMAAAGRHGEALVAISDWKVCAEREQARHYLAVMARLEAECRLALDASDPQARQCLDLAMATAREQGAVFLLQRAEASWARHFATAGDVG